MSYKIVQPSTNSDRVGRFGVSSGAPDNVITFPNESGELTVTTDIPTGLPTIYPLTNTYTDGNNPTEQIISEWNIPVVAGKNYNIEYVIYGKSETANSSNTYIWYQTSSFVNPLQFGGLLMDDNGGLSGVGIDSTGYNMTEFLYAPYIGNIHSVSKIIYGQMFITFECKETGTLRHIFANKSWTNGTPSSSITPGSVMKVTQLN